MGHNIYCAVGANHVMGTAELPQFPLLLILSTTLKKHPALRNPDRRRYYPMRCHVYRSIRFLDRLVLNISAATGSLVAKHEASAHPFEKKKKKKKTATGPDPVLFQSNSYHHSVYL
jgi:hypothetical protein